MTSLPVFTACLSDNVPATSRSVRNVFFNVDTLKSLKLLTLDPVIILKDPTSPQDYIVGTVWPSFDCPPNAIQISSSLLFSAGISSGTLVSIAPFTQSSLPGLPSKNSLPDAKSVIIQTNLAKKGNNLVPLLVRECLVNFKYISLNQIFEVPFEGTVHLISILKIDGEGYDETTLPDLGSLSLQIEKKLWTFGWDSVVVLVPLKPSIKLTAKDQKGQDDSSLLTTKRDPYASVGGLSKQIEQIRDLLEIPLTRPELFHHLGLKPPRGILLHGPPGTGKTHLARAIASSTNSSVLVVNGPELSSAYHGETESKLRDVFLEAKEKSPCIVVLDEVDALVPKREDGGGEVEKRVVATLLTILDGMYADGDDDSARVVVIGTTNRPNAIDPALRRPGRFDKEIEIGVPDSEARYSILQVLLSQSPHNIPHSDLHAFSSKAHGYVGADLSAVVREAGTAAIKRYILTNPSSPMPSNPNDLIITLEDLVSVLPTVRPSAMRSLFIETPTVKYSDIGGQTDVIQKLRESVEWPLLHPEAFSRLGVRPPKGVLLYGPPGCSKTVLARACACESGVNFLAVKGPELLNKFVGESERAVRETFRKARAAAPSIIFFDEIDALGSSRASDSNNDGTSTHEGVLTSLLNEMDGVQELVGVTVIAATNRPEIIDSALMRPGRLDRLLYVGPPDQVAREEILSIRMKEMKVDPNVNIPELAHTCEGCSGAEITALCQEAALLAMKKDIDIPFVPYEAFREAAGRSKRQITPMVLQKFQMWRDKNGN